MPNNLSSLTSHQAVALIAWCRSHDWGSNAVYGNGRVSGLLDCVLFNGVESYKAASFSNLTDLRDWAGY